MKKLLLVLAVVLAGCTDAYKTTDFPALPEGLQDCKTWYVTNSSGAQLYITRCPNSTTSTTHPGKSPRTSVVIDGTEYVRKDSAASKVPK
jgi:hypothetical protein